MYRTGKLRAPAISNERGLTLVEVCLTLLIVGLIVAAASPRLARSHRNLKLRTAAEGVADDINMIHWRAVLSGRQWRFIIWSDGQGYDVERQPTMETVGQPGFASEWTPDWQVVTRRPLPPGSTLRPEGSVLQWGPTDAARRDTLCISDGDERAYEIHIEGARISVVPASTPAL